MRVDDGLTTAVIPGTLAEFHRMKPSVPAEQPAEDTAAATILRAAVEAFVQQRPAAGAGN
jgi:hypothetical protein